ncbi:hypothetical protein BGZ76_010808 [Entomortierella beljakovae]|nr:hypothetical protein BGZ76_010808 [Entomortierella beljakovae]
MPSIFAMGILQFSNKNSNGDRTKTFLHSSDINSTDGSPLRRGATSDIVIWEGQGSLFRIQLDPDMFFVPPSSTGDIIASEGPATYYAKLENSGPLPGWLKFDSFLLEFSGVPAHGTYKQTTILTVVVDASTVPGYTQATVRFNIKVLVHTLALSTLPSRTCSSSVLYTSHDQDSLWQYYLPDLTLDTTNRTVHFELNTALFRIDNCIQPARPTLNIANSSDIDHGIIDLSANTRRQGLPQTPTLTQITIQLSAQTTLELFRSNNTLPDWLTFDTGRWTLIGTIPQYVPARILLDIIATDSFGTSSYFKLQIHTQSVARFTFKQLVPDVWIKSGKPFEVDLPLSEYLTNTDDTTLHPIESKFVYEVIDPLESNPNIQYNSEPTTFRLSNHYNTTTKSAVRIASCTSSDLWRQESQGNEGKALVAIFPSWFGQHSLTTSKPILSGTVPCEATIRVRWVVKSGQNQHAATEFLVHATLSGLLINSSNPHDPTLVSQRHDGISPVGFKIAVAFAIALPVILTIWFFIKRFCLPPKIDQTEQNVQQKARRIDLESGWPATRDGRSPDFAGADIGIPHRSQLTSEVVTSSQPDYRSSYEDDPSVGHRDSFSEKYVAEHQPWTCSSENEGEGSGSERTLTIGWLLGEKSPLSSPMVEGSSFNSGDLTLRRLNSDASKYSLKRVSVGYPFECSRFGFVNGSRISHYDCSPTIAPHDPDPDINVSNQQEQENKIEVNVARSTDETPQQISIPPAVPRRSDSKRSKSTFKRASRLLRHGNDNESKRRNRSGSNVNSSFVKGDNSNQSKPPNELESRVCHSSVSSGTGYMASMSECNTSIDERQDSAAESGDDLGFTDLTARMNEPEMDELAKARRRLSRTKLKSDIKDIDHEERISWTPILDLDTGIDNAIEFDSYSNYNGGLKPDRLSGQIIRSDSGALMTNSIGTSISNLQVFTAANTTTITNKPRSKTLEGISSSRSGVAKLTVNNHSSGQQSSTDVDIGLTQCRAKFIEKSGQSGSNMSVFYTGGDELQFSIQPGLEIKKQSIDENSHRRSEEVIPMRICTNFKDHSQDQQSCDRRRPLSYPSTSIAAPLNLGVSRKHVRATIGTAFHYISPLCGPSPSSLLVSSTPLSPLDQLLASSKSPLIPNSSSALSGQGAEQAIGEYKAYLVSDSQGQVKPLPDWIQFNSRLCSIWGRPTPGTAGEWHICLVQSHPPDPQMQSESVVELIVLIVRELSDVPLSPI